MAGKWKLLTDVWYLRVEEIAALLEVHGRTVRRWRDAGKLEAVVTPGGAFLHPVEQLAERFPLLFPEVWPDWESYSVPDVLKPGELLHIFRITDSTLARWHTDGLVKAFVIPSGHRRYPSDQFSREFVAKRLMSLNGRS